MAGDTTAPDGKTGDSELFISKISDGTNTYTIKDTEARSELSNKQDTLVSGNNIKTINSTSVLGSGDFTLADQSLSNLDSTGQMIVDSQNGTISNCILEIPQNIKLTLENNVLTLKAGSILTRYGEGYVTITTTEDKVHDYSSASNGRYVQFAGRSTGNLGYYKEISLVGSGDSLPADDSTYSIFYLTTDKKIYFWNTETSDWKDYSGSYPICLVDVNNGIASFAKDSNGNDMIFNGACFIGHHAVVYPNVKGLKSNGFNEDGSLASNEWINNSLQIVELGKNQKNIMARIDGCFVRNYFDDINDAPNDTSRDTQVGYDKEKNQMYYRPQGTSNWNSEKGNYINIVDYTYDGTTVTDFTIRQPIRLATTEILNNELTQKQDTLVSGTNIKTINSTSVLGNGNFALADQSLSNLDSNGQMVVDSQNSTISNCILDIPQNLKLEFSNGTVTLKAGSIITRTGSTYSTLTTTQDITWSSSTQANKKLYLFATNSGNAYGLYNSVTLEKVGSGDTLPANDDTYSKFYLTTDKIIYSWSDGSWQTTNLAYPLAIVETDENTNIKGFAKDSNGNDMIFNGTCFVGHHAVVYPNVKMLIPNGFNEDGSLKSKNITIKSVRIIDLTSSFTQAEYANILYVTLTSYSGQIGTLPIGDDVETKEDILSQPVQGSTRFYVKNENTIRNYNGITEVTKFVHFKLDSNNIVTDFTIRQPVRMATVEMLDTLQDQIDTNMTAISGKADQSLSNLDSNGQMVVDSQSSTISNCILDIPQNIKLTLENNVLTLKAGSTVVLTNRSTYTTLTTEQDYTITPRPAAYGKRFYILFTGTYLYELVYTENCGSGTELPENNDDYNYFFLIQNNYGKFYIWRSQTNSWGHWNDNGSYPLGLVDVDNEGNMSFAKDSNGNDMIFNGCGFIGHHVFVYPNVKGLLPNGFNNDGRLKSILATTNTLTIVEIVNASTTRVLAIFGDNSARTIGAGYEEVYELPQNPTNNKQYYKIKSNIGYQYYSGAWHIGSVVLLANISSVSSDDVVSITDFTIRQPVRLATKEMLDKKQDTIVGAASTITSNNLTANRVLRTDANGKVNTSSITTTELGYLSGVTSNVQTQLNDKANIGLDNLDSSGQMIINTQNSTISNCVLEIPQNVKLTLENNVLTLKAGSVVTKFGSTYTTTTVTVDKTLTISTTNSDTKIYIFLSGSLVPTGWNFYKVISAASLPESPENNTICYNTTDRLLYKYSSGSWATSFDYYPICILEKDSNNNWQFAKDSNGNDMIFNGAGFIGHHAFVYPNIKALIPNGFNEDGSLKSISNTNNILTIIEMIGTAPTGYVRAIQKQSNNYIGNFSYREVDDLSELDNSDYYSYVKSKNQIYTGKGVAVERIALAFYTISGTTVTDFTIRHPVRLATTEMLSTELAEKADKSTTYTKTEVDTSLALKANANEVVTLSGNQTITGTKNVYGTNFKVTNADQFKLSTYDTRIDRGTPPSQWTGMFPYLLVDKTNKRLSGLYCSYATDMNNEIQLIAYKGTSLDPNDFATTGIRVGYTSNTTGYIRLSNQTYPNPTATTSDYVADVGFVNTRLNTRLQLVSVMPVSPNSETIYFVTTGQIYYGSTLIVDNRLESITGYDATATQTLKNINGTLTWVTDV